MKTSNLSADNLKKILDLDGLTPEPAIQSGDTGQRIPCFHSCQLITTLMCNMCAISAFLCSQMRVNIGCAVVRTDGRAMYGHVITEFSGMGRFTCSWCSAGALRVPELHYKLYQQNVSNARYSKLCRPEKHMAATMTEEQEAAALAVMKIHCITQSGITQVQQSTPLRRSIHYVSFLPIS